MWKDIRKCQICGKEFMPRMPHQFLCFSEECRTINRLRISAEYRRRQRQEEKDAENFIRDVLYVKHRENTLIEDAKEAKKLGMNYGYYMALVKNGGVQKNWDRDLARHGYAEKVS